MALYQFLGLEDPLEKEMAPHSSILTGEFHRQRSQAGYSPQSQRVGHDEQLTLSLSQQPHSPRSCKNNCDLQQWAI